MLLKLKYFPRQSRDELVYQIINEKATDKETVNFYNAVNDTINNLKFFNWSFYSKAMNLFFSDLFDNIQIIYNGFKIKISISLSKKRDC